MPKIIKKIFHSFNGSLVPNKDYIHESLSDFYNNVSNNMDMIHQSQDKINLSQDMKNVKSDFKKSLNKYIEVH